MTDLEQLQAYHASDATVFTATVADAAQRVPSVRVKRVSPTERRIRALEADNAACLATLARAEAIVNTLQAQVAELTRRLDEADGGK